MKLLKMPLFWFNVSAVALLTTAVHALPAAETGVIHLLDPYITLLLILGGLLVYHLVRCAHTLERLALSFVAPKYPRVADSTPDLCSKKLPFDGLQRDINLKSSVEYGKESVILTYNVCISRSGFGSLSTCPSATENESQCGGSTRNSNGGTSEREQLPSDSSSQNTGVSTRTHEHSRPENLQNSGTEHMVGNEPQKSDKASSIDMNSSHKTKSRTSKTSDVTNEREPRSQHKAERMEHDFHSVENIVLSEVANPKTDSQKSTLERKSCEDVSKHCLSGNGHLKYENLHAEQPGFSHPPVNEISMATANIALHKEKAEEAWGKCSIPGKDKSLKLDQSSDSSVDKQSVRAKTMNKLRIPKSIKSLHRLSKTKQPDKLSTDEEEDCEYPRSSKKSKSRRRKILPSSKGKAEQILEQWKKQSKTFNPANGDTPPRVNLLDKVLNFLSEQDLGEDKSKSHYGKPNSSDAVESSPLPRENIKDLPHTCLREYGVNYGSRSTRTECTAELPRQIPVEDFKSCQLQYSPETVTSPLNEVTETPSPHKEESSVLKIRSDLLQAPATDESPTAEEFPVAIHEDPASAASDKNMTEMPVTADVTDIMKTPELKGQTVPLASNLYGATGTPIKRSFHKKTTPNSFRGSLKKKKLFADVENENERLSEVSGKA